MSAPDNRARTYGHRRVEAETWPFCLNASGRKPSFGPRLVGLCRYGDTVAEIARPGFAGLAPS